MSIKSKKIYDLITDEISSRVKSIQQSMNLTSDNRGVKLLNARDDISRLSNAYENSIVIAEISNLENYNIVFGVLSEYGELQKDDVIKKLQNFNSDAIRCIMYILQMSGFIFTNIERHETKDASITYSTRGLVFSIYEEILK